jgi:hypothetical protein
MTGTELQNQIGHLQVKSAVTFREIPTLPVLLKARACRILQFTKYHFPELLAIYWLIEAGA